MTEPLPPQLKRFILTSIDSIPHLEAVLLLRAKPDCECDAKNMAQRLFISEKKATEIMNDLCKSGFASLKGSGLYCYDPITPKLRSLIDVLNEFYAKNLIEVTNLIHSNISRQAQSFGDAFKWQDE